MLPDQIVNTIVQATPLEFWRRADEGLMGAYHDAYQKSRSVGNPQRRRVFGQLQHYLQDAALTEIAASCGLQGEAQSTDPAGEFYVPVKCGPILLSRTSVLFGKGVIRPARHRKLLAARNARFEPTCRSLFDEDTEQSEDDCLGCLLVTVRPHRSSKENMPAGIFVGVPYSSLRGWHVYRSIESIIGAYEQPADVEDIAFPEMRQMMKKAEEE